VNSWDERRGAIGRGYDAWQIRRLRRAYTRVSGWCSTQSGLKGLIEELTWGLDHLPEEVRERADKALLTTVMGGTLGVGLIRMCAALMPKTLARLFTRLTPDAFGFLVGEVSRTGAHTLVLPECKFVSEGGRKLCLHVCQAPTEKFFTAGLRLPLRMDPDLESFRCHWCYGAKAVADGK
jgi:hypothetical protein